MSRTGKLRLKLVDVYGRLIREKVDILLRHQVLSDYKVIRSVSASKKLLIEDLYCSPQGLYRIEVDPPSYLAVSHFVNIKASDMTDLQITFPIDFKKVRHARFPSYEELPEDARKLCENSDQVVGFIGKKGRELYDTLDETRKAGLLNIIAKARTTPLSNRTTVLPYLERLNELRGDRFFAVVPKALREETKNSVAEELFHPVSGLLHHPPAGYTGAGSFKTEDRYGNLQLSFFMNGNRCVADVDIDEGAGLKHVFQVVRNMLPGRSTHPYDIQQILIFHQKLDPGYELLV